MMKKERVIEILGRFKDKKVCVVGDILLDSYIIGRSSRVNPERPGYPLLTVEKEENRLGGAANVAVNLAGLGSKVSLFGVIGRDKYGLIIKKLCRKRGVKLFPFIDKKTIVKQRLIESTHNDYFGRVDFGENAIRPISEKCANILFNGLIREKPDVIILSDYNKGLFMGDFAKRLIRWANNKGIKSVVDPKPVNISSFENATLLCHNLKEAKEVIGVGCRNIDFEEIVKKLKEITKINLISVTCGPDGIISYDDNFNKIPTKSKEIVDVTGAGDTTTAVISLALISEANLFESSYIANVAAGIVCGKSGTANVRIKEIVSNV